MSFAWCCISSIFFFFFQAEDGIRDTSVTGVQTCALPISRHDHRGPGAILHETEAEHEANGPNSDENEERERAVEAQQSFTGLGLRDEANHEFPSFPGGPVKKASQAELSRDAARENDGFESVPEHDQKDRDTCRERSGS